MKIVVVFLLCLVAVLVSGETRVGSCPDSKSHALCDVTCEADDTCPETEKCCVNSCGTSSCAKPIDGESTTANIIELPKEWIQFK